MSLLQHQLDFQIDFQKLAEHFSVGETVILNILKDSKNLRRDYEFVKGSYKIRRHGKNHIVNEILYK